MKKICFFQPVISIHQLPMLLALGELGWDVHLYTFYHLDHRRLSNGWNLNDGATLGITHTSLEDVSNIESFVDFNAVNIISGFCVDSYTRKLTRYFMRNNKKYYLYSEGGNDSGFLFPLRYLKNRYYSLRYSDAVKAIFAIGDKGVNWFRLIGFTSENIVNFKYYTSLPCSDYSYRKDSPPKRNIAYLGRLVEGKGLIKLVKSFGYLDGNIYQLNIYGDGDLFEEIKSYIENNALDKVVIMHGAVKNSEIDDIFSNSDLLCLINDGDEGWGAVVNESLTRGVPVLCTHKTGASGLIKMNSNLGVVIDDLSPNSIAESIRVASAFPKDTIFKWASDNLNPKVGAEIITRMVDNENNH